MRALGSFAFGVAALIVAHIATTAQAKADSFDVFVGSHGFGIQVSNYGAYSGYYDPGYYGAVYYGGGGCFDPYYRVYVACGYPSYYARPYYSGYHYRPRWHHRPHWRGGNGWYGNRWNNGGHGWRGHPGGQHGWSHARRYGGHRDRHGH